MPRSQAKRPFGRAQDLGELIENNRAWAAEMARDHPGYFGPLGSQNAPQFLWVGCSDARVPANEIVGLAPGELFVHRNIANIVSEDDDNAMTVLELAVGVLGVPHIIVCGHYHCYGVQTAWRRQASGRASAWLRHVEEVADRHEDLLDACPNEEAALRCLSELNAIEQAASVCRTEVVRQAWEQGLDLSVHAWVYQLENGLLGDLQFQVGASDELDSRLESALYALARRAREPVSPT